MSRGTKDLKRIVNIYRSGSPLNPSTSDDPSPTGANNVNLFNSLISSNTQPRSDSQLSDTSTALASSYKRQQRLRQLAEDDQDLIQTLKHRLEDQKRELDHRYESIQSIQRNFENMTHLYQAEVSKNSELKDQLSVSEKKLSELLLKSQQDEIAENQIQLLHLQYSELLDKKEKTDQILNLKLSENAKLNQKLLDLNEGNLRLRDQLEASEERTSKTRDELKMSEEIVRKTKAQLTQLQLEFDAQKESSTRKDFEIKRLTANLLESQRKCTDLEDKFRKDENAFNQLQDKKLSLEDERQQFADKIEKLLGEYAEQEKRVQILEAKIHRRVKDYQQLEEQCQKLGSDKAALEQIIKDKDDRYQKLLDLKYEVDKQLAKSIAENEENLVKIRDFEDQLQDAQDSTLLQQRAVSILELKVNEKDEEIKELQDKLHWNVNTLDNESERVKKMEEDYRLEIQKLQSEKEQMIEEVRSKTEDVERLTVELANSQGVTQEAELKELQGRVVELQYDVDHFKKMSNDNQAELNLLNHRFQELKKDRDSLQVQHDQLLRDSNPNLLREQRELAIKWREESEIARQQLLDMASERSAQIEREQRLADLFESQKEELERLRKTEPLLERLRKRETHLHNVIDKLLRTEEATESTLTCMACMNLFSKPCVCVPCGHAYCEKCWDDHTRSAAGVVQCMECNKRVSDTTSCEILDILAQKSVFRKQQLETLLKISKEKTGI